ncbi:MAG: hypothetical protein IJ708_11770 [Clostridia bacterium]|nr:hypothetical protein [Clostridia bacterium]
MEKINLPALWYCTISGGKPAGEAEGMLRLPGTLDESGIGFPEEEAQPWHPDAKIERTGEKEITTRLTRVCTFEGCARIRADFLWSRPDGCRVFLDAERARCLKLRVNGSEVAPYVPFSLSAPQSFEVTDYVKGLDRLELEMDNSYPGLPHDDIVFSSAATDETQTNWNGILGEFCLRMENPVFFSSLRVYPGENTADVCVQIDAAHPWKGSISLFSRAFAAPVTATVDLAAGVHDTWVRGIPYSAQVERWDLGEGKLYDVSVSADGLDTLTASFGVRTLTMREGMFTVNGRVIFLRAEANCAVFPETGYPPMDEKSWENIIARYRAYGVNCLRFHSHVPPQAAFRVADRMGMLMQPELPCWNPAHAFETEESARFYKEELRQVLQMLANYPSFVMLTFGNELQAEEEGQARMREMLKLAREIDTTRFYAEASNAFYGAKGPGPDSDFYTSSGVGELPLRAAFAGPGGHLYDTYPSEDWDYREGMQKLRETYPNPVIAFEVGQFEILPDFSQLDRYKGVTRPENLLAVRRRAEKRGMLGEWESYVQASAALSLQCYRAEVEANLRTGLLAGISLLGLQDFPGQGTALVGMMDAHLEPKPTPFTQPECFRAFFRDVLPLVLLPRYTYVEGEVLRAGVKIANYGKGPVQGKLTWRLSGGRSECAGEGEERVCPEGAVTGVGEICVPLPEGEGHRQLTLTVRFGEAENSYPLWVYRDEKPRCPACVHEVRRLDDQALAWLAQGERVYLSPAADEASMPSSIRTFFPTDFWSVGTFPKQPGGMGQLIDTAHPALRHFPTAQYSQWQWWAMASTRAYVLPDDLKIRPVIREMDSYARMRNMAQLFEVRVGKGRLLVSSMGLQDLQQYPEARALLSALYAYMAGDDFCPEYACAAEQLHFLRDKE